jgi:hypothetical protein
MEIHQLQLKMNQNWIDCFHISIGNIQVEQIKKDMENII